MSAQGWGRDVFTCRKSAVNGKENKSFYAPAAGRGGVSLALPDYSPTHLRRTPAPLRCGDFVRALQCRCVSKPCAEACTDGSTLSDSRRVAHRVEVTAQEAPQGKITDTFALWFSFYSIEYIIRRVMDQNLILCSSRRPRRRFPGTARHAPHSRRTHRTGTWCKCRDDVAYGASVVPILLREGKCARAPQGKITDTFALYPFACPATEGSVEGRRASFCPSHCNILVTKLSLSMPQSQRVRRIRYVPAHSWDVLSTGWFAPAAGGQRVNPSGGGFL